jgi:5'-nucleotidase
MRALITNDDGVHSVGIRTLAEVAARAGLEVTVAAPHQERSGSSAALSAVEADGRLLMQRRPIDGLDSVEVFSVHASPALIAFVGARGAFGEPPDVLLSGTNHGPNTGSAILHSGTVGAALTASTQGLPALAVSLATGSPTYWGTASQVASQALTWFLAHVHQPCVLNINVPDIPVDRLRGLHPAALAAFGAVEAVIGERGQGYVNTTFKEVGAESEPGTDVALLHVGWATATVLQAPCASTVIDLSSLHDGAPVPGKIQPAVAPPPVEREPGPRA